jgi:hypothetical protein
LIAFCSVCAAKSPPEGFEQIFNRENLDGWDGPPGAWRVEDGALTWESTADNPLKKNDELVWTGGEPADFELLIDFKLSKGANSGVNVRSEYHVDMHDNGWVVGSIYTYARVYPKGLLSGRGEKTVITTEGERRPVEFGGGHGGPLSKVFFRGQWNTMRVVCRGPRILHYVNGELMTEITDNDPRAPKKGSISLQMHTGSPMKIQFKNIFLKRLPSSDEESQGEMIDLLASRDLDDWDFFLVDPTLKKEDVWRFTDEGVLVCKGKPLGYLCTKKDYKNFKLIVEWTWECDPSNSGVQFRITGEPKGIPCCIEAQLKYGEAGDIYGLWGKHVQGKPMWEKEDTSWGGHVRVIRKKVAAEKMLGYWNRYVITAIDDEVVLEINGQEVNRATGCDQTPGRIGFQSEGDVIEFRTAKLYPLD